MSNGSNKTPYQIALEKRLFEATYPNLPTIRIVTRRAKHSERLAERIQKNAELADQLIKTIKELNRKQGTETQVDRLIDIVKDLLENNAKFREQVGDAIQDIPTNG